MKEKYIISCRHLVKLEEPTKTVHEEMTLRMQVFNREQDERRISKRIQKPCGWRNVTHISERKTMCLEPTEKNGDMVHIDTTEVVRAQIK